MSDEYEEINKPKKKRSGPSMREQIAARRKAEAEAGGKGEAPAAKPMPRAAQKPAAKPAPKAAAKPAAPVRRAAAAKADDGDEAPAPRRRASGGASSRSSARRAGGSRSRRGKGDDGDDEGGSTRGRRGRQEKKKSPMPMIAGVVVIAAIGGGAWFAMSNGGETEASETDGTEVTDTAEGTDAADTATDTQAEAPAADAAAEDAGTEATDADTTAEEPAAEPEAAPEPASEPNIENGVPTGIREGFDPNSKSTRKRSIEELMAMIAARAERPAFEKPEGVDDATWASAQEKAAIMAGGGGRRVTQAGKELAEMGKAGYVALANELIKLDYSNAEQFFNANAMTDAANAARGSDNPLGYGWRDSMTTEMPEGGDIRFNLKILVQIYDGWEKAVEDPSYWERKLWLGDEYESDQKRAVENLDDEFGDISDDDFDFDN